MLIFCWKALVSLKPIPPKQRSPAKSSLEKPYPKIPIRASPLTHHPRQRQRLLVKDPCIQVQQDNLIFLKSERKLDHIPLDPDTPGKLHMQLKIQLPPSIPLEQRLLRTPDQRQELLLHPT